MGYSLISVFIFLADSIIKKKVEKNIASDSVQLIGNEHFLLRKYHNKGAILNAFDKHQKLMAAISTGFTVFLAFLGVDAFLDKNRSAATKLGFAFLIGGACSNTLDRIQRGYVVDYVSFNVKWERLKRIVFNISDFFIMGGAILMALFGNQENKEK